MIDFIFRIQTKTGGIVENVVIQARDQYEDENKLRKRYPECTILFRMHFFPGRR